MPLTAPRGLGPCALALALALGAAPVRADPAAVGLAPLALLVPAAAVGGVITTVWVGGAVARDAPVDRALRSVTVGLAGLNLLAGGVGLVAAAVSDEDGIGPVLYGVGGALAALGATGLVLGLVVDTAPAQARSARAVVLVPTGAGAALVGTF